MSFASERLALFVIALIAAPLSLGQTPAPTHQTEKGRLEIVLVEAGMVTPAALSQWKGDQFQGVAVLLDERTGNAAYREIGRRISESGLGLYFWIEVGRNPKLATEHPRWMAALGSHADWQKKFPGFPEPGIDEVAKAFPWVPIAYTEAFDAQLKRIEQLLERAPPDWRGLLLNDLQAGPSSCGCGNLLCRWAIDYHVRSTTAKLGGDDVSARFVAEVRKRAGNKTIIPVWTTECEKVDLPPDKQQGRAGTGLCGSVGCATGACPTEFAHQWSALAARHDGPIALLALHSALQRTQNEFGGGPGWVTNALAYMDQTLSAQGAKAPARDRIWAVIEGVRADEEKIARDVAIKAGVAAIVVARAKIDQSYEPKMVRVK
jgi:hypothetical protein